MIKALHSRFVRAEGLRHNEEGASKTVIRNTRISVNQLTLFSPIRPLGVTIREVLNVRCDHLDDRHSNRWMLAMPFSSKLVSMARPEYFGFRKLTADELCAYREPVGGKPTRHAQRRYAAEVEGLRKNIIDYKAIPFLCIDLERVFGFSACRV